MLGVLRHHRSLEREHTLRPPYLLLVAPPFRNTGTGSLLKNKFVVTQAMWISFSFFFTHFIPSQR